MAPMGENLAPLLNTPGHSGHTAIWFAARNGHAQVVRELLLLGAVPTMSDQCDVSPLMAAVMYGCLETVSVLLDHGQVRYHINQRMITPPFQTALGLASVNGHDRIVSALVIYARADQIPQGVHSALVQAVIGGHPTTVKVLLQYHNGSVPDVMMSIQAAIRRDQMVCLGLLIHHCFRPDAMQLG